MNHKVLLADDSLTIQKVIKITLANQPYDIVDCANDEDLFKLLPQVKPDLVFLDFNLSEKFTGYELTSKIKAIHPSAKVLLLLGTFDTVDDAAMEKCGAADKVVKPFDSNKFIAICKRLLDTAPLEEKISYPDLSQLEEPDMMMKETQEDQWQMNRPVSTQAETPVKEEITKPFDVRDHLNPLDQEVSEWGMSVPGIINDKSSDDNLIELPPIMGKASAPIMPVTLAPVQSSSHDLIKYPENDDLDYPTIEELEVRSEPKIETPKKESKLVSLEALNLTVGNDLELEIEHNISSMVETDISSIEAQIRDEVEENLWSVDEFEDVKKHVEAKIQEAKNIQIEPENKFDENLFKPLDDHDEIQWNATVDSAFTQPVEATRPSVTEAPISNELLMRQLRNEVDEMVKKYVKEYMDQMFTGQVEKISWEVIPDLAENIIKKEISKISNKILND